MFDFFASAAVTLLIVVDPVALAPIFLGVTADLSDAERRQVAWRSSGLALAILVVFAAIGAPLLDALGIGLPAFRIAGGLLLFVISFEMIFAHRAERKPATNAAAAAESRANQLQTIAVFPLAIPLMAGPGAITAIMLLAGQAEGDPARLAGLFAITVVVVASCLAVYLAAEKVNAILGVTGNAVLSRLLGIILAALAVQFVVDGIKAAFAP
ncbi:MAG TPA: MarC family protein [Xanthobacteraceae bacterium]|nr:MarC family protein [Xanthobacteraceae bacterium]